MLGPLWVPNRYVSGYFEYRLSFDFFFNSNHALHDDYSKYLNLWKKIFLCITNYITAGWTLIEAEIRIPNFFRYVENVTK